MNTESLLKSARALAGTTFQGLSSLTGIPIPPGARVQTKGWLGQVLEQQLGATAGSQSLPDFVELGIELKTIPILPNGAPKESTYVCTAPIPIKDHDWEHSRVYQKLQKVLWFPYFYNKEKSFAEQQLCTPLLWSPTPKQYAQLKADWEELVECLNIGQVENLTAQVGQHLQLRPKASRSTKQTAFINPEGELISTTPKGFYLRSRFTHQILLENYLF